MYKVALYTCNTRYECRSKFANLEDAKLLYSRLCITYDELPIDSICALEKNDTVLQAYRFTRTNHTFKVDQLSTSFQKLSNRLAGSTTYVKPPSAELTHRLDRAQRNYSLEMSRASSVDIGEVSRLIDQTGNLNIRQRVGKFVRQILGTSKR